MKFIILLATLVLSVNALPYLRDLLKREEIIVRELTKRDDVIGCKADPNTEVLFLFDTSDGVSREQFAEDRKFAAENAIFLAKQVKISAALYGGRVVFAGSFPVNDAKSGLIGISNERVGGPRDVAGALKYAEKEMKSTGRKIVVLIVNDKLADNAAAEAAAASLPGSFRVYTAVNSAEYNNLKPEMKKIASEFGLLRSKGWQMAESFQLDLNVKYKGDPSC